MCAVGDELLQTDRHTDTTKLIVACRNFENAPKGKIVTGT